jgi:hypothetical protein
MKHLSRVLSLALVIALSLGLVVTAGAKNVGDYPDSDAITPAYVEAVDVLTALGVFQGDDNGSLNPQGTFTRAQAAKIVAYISIGTTAADRLSARPSSFTDVATSHWANPFIEYAVEKGIINGVGGGRFNPEGPVTGAQLAKMLLVALGRGAKDEYVGASWEINAIVDGQSYGILTVDADYSAPAKREEAIQYTFNTIRPNGSDADGNPYGKNFLVKYTSLIDDYILANGSTFQTGTAQYIGTEVFSVFAEYDYDDFGFDGHYWRVGAKRISETFYKDGVVLAEFATNATVSLGGLYSQYEWNDDLYVGANDIEYWINGEFQSYEPSSTFAVKNSTIFAAFPAGYYVTLMDTTSKGGYGPDGKVDKVVATFGSLAKVATVNATTGQITVDRYFVNGGQKTYSKALVDATGYSVGDYIVITPIGDFIASTSVPTETLSIEKANIVTAKATSYTTDAGFSGVEPGLINSITADGKTYYVSQTEALTYASDISFENDIVFYLDSHDTIVGYDGSTVTAASLNYLYIRGLSDQFAAANGFADGRASVTYSDGTRGIITLVFKADGTLTGDRAPVSDYPAGNSGVTGDPYGWKTALEGGWFSYTVNTSGNVVLSTLRPAADSTGDLSSNISLSAAPAAIKYTAGSGPVFSGKYATSTTVLKINGSTYTGYSRFPARDFTDGQLLVVYAEQNGVVTSSIAAIYIITDTAVDSGEYGVIFVRLNVTGGKSFYMVKTAHAKAGGADVCEYIYDETGALTNHPMGAVVHIETASDGTRSIGDLVEAPVNGVYSSPTIAGTITRVDPTYILIDGTALYYTSTDTVFFDLIGIDTATEWLEGDAVVVYGGEASNSTYPPYAIIKTGSLEASKAALSIQINAAASYAPRGIASFGTDLSNATTALTNTALTVAQLNSYTDALKAALDTYASNLNTAKTTSLVAYSDGSAETQSTVETNIISAVGDGYLAATGTFEWSASSDSGLVKVKFADGEVIEKILSYANHSV